MIVYCCGCQALIEPRLTDGKEIYPGRKDLGAKPFWKCNKCSNYVGCHHQTTQPTQPLGCIATPEIREARKNIHAKLDPIWKSGVISRSELYRKLSKKLGWEYHTAHIRSVEQAKEVCKVIIDMRNYNELHT